MLPVMDVRKVRLGLSALVAAVLLFAGPGLVSADGASHGPAREFLAALSGRLENEDAKTFALALLLRLLEADNQVVESEQSFHAAAKAAFGI